MMSETLEIARKRAIGEIESQNIVTERNDNGYTAKYTINLKNGLRLTAKSTCSTREQAFECASKIAQTNLINIFIYIEYEKEKVASHRFDDDPPQLIVREYLFQDS